MTANQAGKPELVFALVGGAGVRLNDLRSELSRALESFGYQCEHINVSDLLTRFTSFTPVPDKTDCPEYARIKHLQEVAFQVRKMADPAALARAGIAAIQERRAARTKDPNAPACAYILQQLKHPKEVALLRRVYGQSIMVLGGHATHGSREIRLCQVMAGDTGSLENNTKFKNYAADIIDIDQKERRFDDSGDLGQNTRDTYPLADFFVNLERAGGERDIWRFVELLFGHPFHTPEPDEVAMYQANAVSLRSSDGGRQVGAVIVHEGSNPSRPDLDIIATGLNEVPRAGGGYYWHGSSPDNRDQALTDRNEPDRAQAIKRFALTEIVERLKEQKWLTPDLEKQHGYDLARRLYPLLKGTQFMDIGEFMRPVHAEMAALIDAARRGVAVQGKTMYVTTFPCHNCAKHIIAAGIRRVVYLEPYPKSRAELLHREELNMDAADGKATDDRVAFGGFTGVAPRQYARLYGMSARGEKNGEQLKDWRARRQSLWPRYVLQNAAAAYLVSEREEVARLVGKGYRESGEGGANTNPSPTVLS
jgi:cytidine deaminase